MTRKLLIYEAIEPVTPQRHGKLSIQTGHNYSFAHEINSVPVTAVEFPNVVWEYPIVFTGSEDNLMPVAILGFRNDENIFVDSKGNWKARYIPAFIRRYPFVFSSADEGKTFTLCLDRQFSGCNEDGAGERLFDDAGVKTGYLDSVLDFLKEYQFHYQRTDVFTRHLKELDLLEPMSAQYTSDGGDVSNLTGFMAVNRERLKKLEPEKLQALAGTDELELIYLHIQSLYNFGMMPERGRNDGRAGTTPSKNPAARKKPPHKP